MALVKCYKCKHVVNGDTEVCSICGTTFKRMGSAKSMTVLIVAAAILFSVVLWLATIV